MTTRAHSWFRFSNQATDPTVAEIHIIDFIGDWLDDAINRFWDESIGVTARAFVEQLAALPSTVSTIHVHINSPGGDVQGGINIANALREQQAKGRTVETFIDGIAASIASVIAMAGSKVHIGDNALVMVHNPWTIALGDAAAMRKTAETLDTIRTQIVNTYRWHSALEEADLVALMDAETWMDADTAIANGFATDKIAGLQAAASIHPKASALLKVPPQYRDRVAAFVTPPPSAPMPAEASDVLARCAQAGLDLAFAQTLLGAPLTADEVQARITAEQQTRAAAAARARDITALCEAAHHPELAEGYIRGQMAVADVRVHLTTIRAKHQVDINGALPVDPAAGRAKAGFTAAEIYAARNSRTKES